METPRSPLHIVGADGWGTETTVNISHQYSQQLGQTPLNSHISWKPDILGFTTAVDIHLYAPAQAPVLGRGVDEAN